MYKQLGGLKYHLSHVRLLHSTKHVYLSLIAILNFMQGHPPQLPAQLDSVPPVLARKENEKIQKQATGA